MSERACERAYVRTYMRASLNMRAHCVRLRARAVCVCKPQQLHCPYVRTTVAKVIRTLIAFIRSQSSIRLPNNKANEYQGHLYGLSKRHHCQF